MRLLTILSLVLLTACGADDSDDSSVTATANAPEIAGTWVSNCIESGTVYLRATYSFTGAVNNLTVSAYSDECINLIQTDFSVRTFSLGDAVEGLSETYQIDYTTSSVTRTIRDAAFVAEYNNIAAFGYSDWSLNTAKDVTGRAATSTDTPQAAAGSIMYQIVRVVGDKIYVGDSATGDTTSPGARPSSLNTSFVFDRQ